jgi:hypothetical protein
VFRCVCVRVCVCVCVYVLRVFVYRYVCSCVCVCMFMCVRVCVYVCFYVYFSAYAVQVTRYKPTTSTNLGLAQPNRFSHTLLLSKPQSQSLLLVGLTVI